MVIHLGPGTKGDGAVGRNFVRSLAEPEKLSATSLKAKEKTILEISVRAKTKVRRRLFAQTSAFVEELLARTDKGPTRSVSVRQKQYLENMGKVAGFVIAKLPITPAKKEVMVESEKFTSAIAAIQADLFLGKTNALKRTLIAVKTGIELMNSATPEMLQAYPNAGTLKTSLQTAQKTLTSADWQVIPAGYCPLLNELQRFAGTLTKKTVGDEAWELYWGALEQVRMRVKHVAL
jgi:hypothetical protein